MLAKPIYRILIAEDSQTQAQTLKHLLEEHGYFAEIAGNGLEALGLVRETPPDLLITDVVMPALDGHSLCKAIKSEKNLPEIPVLLVTSLGKSEDILTGLECGADKFLIKPYDKSLLLEKVESLLQNNRQNNGSRLGKPYQINYRGDIYKLNTSRRNILDMMLTAYEAAVQKKHKLKENQNSLNSLKGSLEMKVADKTANLMERINERRHIESEIKLSEQKYRNLIDDALLGVFLCDTDCKFSYVNKSLVSMLAYPSEEELMRTKMKRLFHNQAHLRDIQDRIKKEHKIDNLEVELVNRDKEIRWGLLNLTRNEQNLTGVILDITKDKMIKEIESIVQEELRIAKEEAEESDRQKTVFLSKISSDIKKPINVISGYSSLLKGINNSPEQRLDYMAQMKQGTNLLSVQIKNMLDLARLEDAQLHLNLSECPINQVLDTLFYDWSESMRLLRGNQVMMQLNKGIEDDSYTLTTDPSLLNDVFTNLLANAIRFTESGSISFGYEVREKDLLFYVSDSGEGIAKENHELIFERFNKADAASLTKGQGAGLGLTISRFLVRRMHGEIWLESEPGKGATFFFTIPLNLDERFVKRIDN